MDKNVTLLIMISLISLSLSAQIGIGTTNPNPSAELDVSSTNKGFLPPRVTQQQRNTIQYPAAGLIVFCTNCGDFGEIQYYNGSSWKRMAVENAQLRNYEQVGGDIIGENYGDWNGWSVSMSANGNRIAIGAPLNNANGQLAGRVRVFDWNGSAWLQVGPDINGETASDRSGEAISLSGDGNRLAIGAPRNNGGTTVNNSGHVRIFNWNGLYWIKLGADIDGLIRDYFGVSVSLSHNGNSVAIGATGMPFSTNTDGRVRIYRWSGASWLQVGNTISGSQVDDILGQSVSISNDGNRVAIGAPSSEGPGSPGSGYVRVYNWEGTAWVQLGSDILGQIGNERSGYSVSLASNVSTLAIGGNHATQSSVSRVYSWTGTVWSQLGSDIPGTTVSISADGSKLAVSAPVPASSQTGFATVFYYNQSLGWIRDGNGISSGIGGLSTAIAADGSKFVVGVPRDSEGTVKIYQ